MSDLEAVLANIESTLDAAYERLFALLRIRSISTDPAYVQECRASADWHVQDLRSIGFGAGARQTQGLPIVVAHDRKSSGRSVLFYGHYDVQPVDPVELWDHDSFEPFIEARPDGSRAIRARGASDGFKTVIPSMASAKISFRLVFDQDPHAIRAAFRDFVRKRVPADCKVEFAEHGGGRAIRFPIEADAFAKTRDALTAEWGRPAVFIGGGGSIPVTAELRQKLDMDVVLAGFALEDDRIHSPNEKYELESSKRGVRSWARVLHALGPQ
jgi:acetylornithine deacetylase/succinyl-diaminopimelate desuccinylase-like protein